MKNLRWLALGLLALPVTSFGASREIVELQRDVATLQDQVRTLQRAFDEKMSALTVLVQQTLDASGKTSNSIAVLESRTQDQLSKQEKQLAAPVASLGVKVDQMSNDFRALQQSMADVLARLGKVDQRIIDLSNSVNTIQAAPAAPSGTDSAGTPLGNPPASATSLYENALKDTRAKRSDLALQQFADYLRYYPTAEMAPNAQFWIGQIYYDNSQYDEALQAFDQVTAKYQDSNKSADALYMKGQTLLKLKRRTEAAQTFQKLYSDYAKTDAGTKACSQLRTLGYRCPARGQ